MYRSIITLIAVSLLVAGCSIGVSTAPVNPPTAPVPMTNLPPVAQPPVPATTTVPRDSEPPHVDATIENGDIVDWYRGEITVITESTADLTVNGEMVTVDADGSASLSVVNAPGENTIIITATDAEGNTTEELVAYSFEPPDDWIAVVGDSIMLAAKVELENRFGNNTVDALVSRKFLEAPYLVSDLIRRESPPQAVVIGLGTNGPVQAHHFDQVMATIPSETLVAFVNVRVPRNWEATSNKELAAGVERYDNAILVDWFTTADHRNELFASDGFHLSEAGRVALADLISAAIIRNVEPREFQ